MGMTMERGNSHDMEHISFDIIMQASVRKYINADSN